MTTFKHGDRVRLWGYDHTPATTGTVTGVTPEGRVLVRWDDNHGITEQVPHYLTPLGEPMSKTFKSQFDCELAIEEYEDDSLSIALTDARGIQNARYHFDPKLAPAIALAILEAAGVHLYRDPKAMAPSLSSIACDLEELVVQLQMEAKEAADREALEHDALELCRTMWDNPNQAWAPMSDKAKETWLQMARKARELNGVTS